MLLDRTLLGLVLGVMLVHPLPHDAGLVRDLSRMQALLCDLPVLQLHIVGERVLLEKLVIL